MANLARRLGVTRATVSSRIDKLVSSGTIVGFTARVREEVDSEEIHAVTLIEVEGRSTGNVIASLRGLPEITSLHTTNGRWDLVAEVRTDSLRGFDALLGRIRGIEGIVNSESSLLLSSVLR